jgi:hypothetical protein
MDNSEPQESVTDGSAKTMKKKKGGRKGWTTAEQEKWLRERIPAYHAAQAGGPQGLAEFWPPLWEGWFLLWPESKEVSSSAVATSSSATDSPDASVLVDHQDEGFQAKKTVSENIHTSESILTPSS